MKHTVREIDSRGLSGRPLPAHPFEEVKLVSFSFSGPKNREDAAFIQYKLLLNSAVIQAHIDFESKKGAVACAPFFDESKELGALGLSPKFSSIKWMPYEQFISKNNKLLLK